MRMALYVIWVLLALLFFALALWSKLEQVSSKTQKHGRQAKDFFRQGVFVSFCVVIAFVFDIYLVDSTFEPLLPEFIPIDFIRVILLPVILYIGAMAVGGSKAEHIKKAAAVSKNRSGGGGSKSSGKRSR
jgi:hypothetical protein